MKHGPIALIDEQHAGGRAHSSRQLLRPHGRQRGRGQGARRPRHRRLPPGRSRDDPPRRPRARRARGGRAPGAPGDGHPAPAPRVPHRCRCEDATSISRATSPRASRWNSGTPAGHPARRVQTVRDVLVVSVILGLVPVSLKRPWLGVLAWYWISYFVPSRVDVGLCAKPFRSPSLSAARRLVGFSSRRTGSLFPRTGRPISAAGVRRPVHPYDDPRLTTRISPGASGIVS